ncbi:MAG: hypothetical protein A2Y02_02230 [Omnitrophica bacterium GWA2_52_12]|nr:MAG: hypothetical protein A2Y02_02230 [Omnitrophica bacterium GWA2_52_12]
MPASAQPDIAATRLIPAPTPEKISALAPASAHTFFTASASTLYKLSRNRDWQTLWHARGEKIHRLQPGDGQALFVLTDHAVFKTAAPQTLAKKVFESRRHDQREVFAFTEWPGRQLYFAGTRYGLFSSRDQGKTWAPHTGFGKQEPVLMLEHIDGRIFLATQERLYLSIDGNAFHAVWTLPQTAAEESAAASGDLSEDNAESLDSIFFMPALRSALSDKERTYWLSTPRGVAESQDGVHWQQLPNHGLQDPEILALVYAPAATALFAGTADGIYLFDRQTVQWNKLARSSDHGKIRGLAIRGGSLNTLTALTDNGIAAFELGPAEALQNSRWVSAPGAERRLRETIEREPSIHSVTRAAIRAGNLSSAKIKRWHYESRLRFFLPQVSFSRSFDQATTVDLDRGGTGDPDRYILGPDDLSRGWNFSVTWDLGDLIWNSAQTSIDSREKLMNDQRRDFLSETVRLYFERRRLTRDLMLGDPAAPGRTDQELQLEETTAQLDALTGGWFREQLE